MRRHHEAFVELHPYKRHHHVASVELRPGLEAPPRYPRGIMSWSRGTTVNPHLEVHEIRSNRWGTTGTPPRRAHGIKSTRWGTTTSPATRVMELRPTQTLLIHYQSIMKFLYIPLTCHLVWMINHRLYPMPSSLPIHLSSPITYIVHAYLPPLYIIIHWTSQSNNHQHSYIKA